MFQLIDNIALRGEPVWLLIGRVTMASLFLPTGLRKLLDPDTFAAYLGKAGMFGPLYFWAVVAAAIEFFGACAVLVGFKTRFAAFLMILFSLSAAFLGHQFWTLEGRPYIEQLINFWKDFAIAGGFLILFVRGAGPLSLDRR